MKYAELFEAVNGSKLTEWLKKHPNATGAQFYEFCKKQGVDLTKGSHDHATVQNMWYRVTNERRRKNESIEVFEHDGETLATTLERGKRKLNSWYAGFYAGFHGQSESDDEDTEYDKGFRRGRAVASQKMNG